MSIQRKFVTLLISTLLAILFVACTPAEPNTNEGAGQATTTEPSPTEVTNPNPTETTETEPTTDITAPQVDTLANQLVGTNWALVSINGMPVAGGLTLEFSADTLHGSDGCNDFGGEYAITDGQLVPATDTFAITAQLCLDENVMETASQYTDAMMHANTISLADGQLTLTHENSELIFAQPETRTLYIGAEQADCVGVAPQKCLLVKEDPNAEYEFFYSNIVGFAWEAGYEYELLVNVSDVVNPPADASSLRYQLVEVVSKTAVEMSNDMAITDTNWSLIHTIVGGDAVVPAPDFANPNFTITDGMVSGNSGCNSFSGTVTTDGNNISFGPLATTRMACDAERMTLETTMLDIFTNAATFTLNDNMLELQNADGLPIALFAAAEQKTLYIGAEMVDCVGVAPQQCMLVKEDPNAEYEFFYDSIGGFEWEAGFEYELLVSVTEVMQPLADASSLQYKLIEIVSKEPIAMAENSLVGTVWQWVAFDSSADNMSYDIENPASYTIQFMDDGTYAIQADCNTGGGSYTHDGNSLTIMPGAITLAACGEDSRDSDFTQLLGDVVTYVFDDDGNLVMNLKIDAGNMVFTAVE